VAPIQNKYLAGPVAMSVESCNEVTVYRGIRKLSDFIKDSYTCVLKMNKGLMGLE